MTPPFSTAINGDWKTFASAGYHYRFNLKTGFFARWGRTPEDDPYRSPFGPEIADIEITTICSGVRGTACGYCYKSNARTGRNMPLDMFKAVIDSINGNNQLTQAALGLGASGEENPAIWEMCAWLRERNIVPNGTVADVSDETADRIVRYFGACAVSDHFLFGGNRNGICYDNVRKLTERGMRQVNIHYVLAEETYTNAFQVLRDIEEDERLRGLNALVFLSLKAKGRAAGGGFHPLDEARFGRLIQTALDRGLNIGFDSCAFPKFARAIRGRPDEKRLLMRAEGCESFGRFSLYVNVEGRCFPCSFCEGTEGWEQGMDVLRVDFLWNIWNGGMFEAGRKALGNNGGECPVYAV